MIPHDEALSCGMEGCNGTVSYHADGFWRCNAAGCDFRLDDEAMNGCDLFVRHLQDQYPGLTPEDMDKICPKCWKQYWYCRGHDQV